MAAETIQMTNRLPEKLESSILAVVHGGQFASVDDAMAEAARLLLRQCKRATPAKALTEDDLDPAIPGRT